MQKRENRLFDPLPESKITFKELTDWYLELKTVKKLASFERISIALNNFNSVRGNQMDVHYIVPTEDTLKQAMEKYTAWLDEQIEAHLQNVDHSVDQAHV